MPEATNKCTCFDDNLVLLKKRVEDKVQKGSIDVDVSWEGYAYFMSGDYSPVNPRVNYEHRLPKQGGGHRANLTKGQVTITACYCCFCGRKLKKSEK